VVAGLTVLNFYFRLYAGSVKAPQAVDFLRALVRHIPQPLTLVWDRLPAHRSRLVACRREIVSTNAAGGV
jgi:hypothetical protein